MYDVDTGILTNGGGTPLEEAKANLRIRRMYKTALETTYEKIPSERLLLAIDNAQARIEEIEETIKVLNEDN